MVIKQHIGSVYKILRETTRYGWQRLRHGKDERSPVLPDEFVLRRIHRNNYNASLPTPVKRPAFEPSKEDHDGLSLHREVFISAKKLGWCGRSPGEYYVARFSITELAADEAHLTVIPAPDIDQPSGHSVIPELKTGSATKPIQKRLASMCTDRIVYRPPPPKTSTTLPTIEPLN